MKLQIYIILFFLSTINIASAQIPDGSIAPDFTATDINGVEHNLYDILAEGKSVVIDFMATWCPPCWDYQQGETLKEYMNLYGPNGTDESIVFMIESDYETTMADLMGQTTESEGDWVTGTNYPIIDKAYIRSLYNVYQYPTVMMICPDRKIFNIGQSSVSVIRSISQNCESIEVASEAEFYASKYQGCGELEVTFFDNSWPRPTEYLWDFGDGTTSSEQNPTHTYTTSDSYSVSLQVTNDFGENTTTKEDYISVEVGSLFSIQSVGPVSNNIGTGKFFAGGNHGLNFDAEEDFNLTSVKVYSEIEETRIIVILDSNSDIIHKKIVNVPAGEQRIQLDMFIPQGNDYTITLHSNAFFYRNNSGTNYPYSINNLVSINSSTVAGNYYYFYDWEVRAAGCDGITAVHDELTKNQTKVYPVPVEGHLMIESEHKTRPKLFNNMGQEVDILFSMRSNGWQVDMKRLETGMYFIKINEEIYKVPKM